MPAGNGAQDPYYPILVSCHRPMEMEQLLVAWYAAQVNPLCVPGESGFLQWKWRVEKELHNSIPRCRGRWELYTILWARIYANG